ncbi:hypothetical protein WA026_002493 [Henosepilachna vigintioctopunctata]|uniref:Uncharacterized protein n=1 Tax=Henosepilachna vigintioctopunctata TaxID=420089 RepID=A0AAW1TZL2_9CUCU
MDSLANYGSDDCEDSSDEGQTEWRPSEYRAKGTQRSSCPEKQADANYEEVQMDLSEESNDGSRNSRERRDRGGSYDDKHDKDSQINGRSRKDYRGRKEDDDLRNRRSKARKGRYRRTMIELETEKMIGNHWNLIQNING